MSHENIDHLKSVLTGQDLVEPIPSKDDLEQLKLLFQFAKKDNSDIPDVFRPMVADMVKFPVMAAKLLEVPEFRRRYGRSPQAMIALTNLLKREYTDYKFKNIVAEQMKELGDQDNDE